MSPTARTKPADADAAPKGPAAGKATTADKVPTATTPQAPGTLAEALVAFQAQMPVVAKTKTATVPTKAGGSYSYKYADLPDVSEAATPVLTRLGLAFTCLPRLTDSGGYELRGRLLHVSGEYLEGSLPLAGRQAQEIGSSITYGRRYLLGCMTGVVTDEDDDGRLAQAAQDRLESERHQEPEEADHIVRLRAYLDTLNDDQVVALRDWWASTTLPGIHHLDSTQTAEVARAAEAIRDGRDPH